MFSSPSPSYTPRRFYWQCGGRKRERLISETQRIPKLDRRARASLEKTRSKSWFILHWTKAQSQQIPRQPPSSQKTDFRLGTQGGKVLEEAPWGGFKTSSQAGKYVPSGTRHYSIWIRLDRLDYSIQHQHGVAGDSYILASRLVEGTYFRKILITFNFNLHSSSKERGRGKS